MDILWHPPLNLTLAAQKNTQLLGSYVVVPSFIKYMQNWCGNGVLSLDITFCEANLDLQKISLIKWQF